MRAQAQRIASRPGAAGVSMELFPRPPASHAR